MSNQAELDKLLQREWRENVIPASLRKQPNDLWIPIYQSRKNEGKVSLAINSVLIPNENVEELLQTPDWGRHAYYLQPGFTGGSEDTDPIYHRFVGSEYGIEPLVILRSFHGLRPDTVEILEEFRLYHNLYEDRQSSKLVRFDAGGHEVDVVTCEDGLVQVARKELRQFLAARDLSLLVFYDRRYHVGKRLEVENDSRSKCVKTDSFVYCFDVVDSRDLVDGKPETYSRLLGKNVIEGLPREKCGIWPYAPEEQERMNQLEEFCIGVDENGDDILASSAPFGRYAATTDLDLPHNFVFREFCTPVFFRRTVLEKYYSEPSKYKVGDSYLECCRLWGLPFDSDQPDFVVVFLGDLGEKLPWTEHAYWKSHNVPRDGNMSDSYTKLSFPATVEEALDPGTENSAFRFKHTFRKFCTVWNNEFGWDLFKPLRNLDGHHFSKLRRPLTNEITEFHEIMLSLSILLQDQIHKKELGKHIPGFQKKDADNNTKHNIPVLAEFLESEQYADADKYVEYLRMLQMLRSNSGTVHPRNEKEYQKAVRFFSLDSKSTIQVADEIFTTLTEFLDSLREHFCPDETG